MELYTGYLNELFGFKDHQYVQFDPRKDKFLVHWN